MTQQFLLYIFTQRKESIRPHKNLYANVDRSFLHNSPKWKESKYLSAEACINKCDSFPTVDDNSAIRKEQRTHGYNNMDDSKELH